MRCGRACGGTHGNSTPGTSPTSVSEDGRVTSTPPTPGSVALITGGTGGFGRALATKLRQGEVTALLAHLDGERNPAVAAEPRGPGRRAQPVGRRRPRLPVRRARRDRPRRERGRGRAGRGRARPARRRL